MKKLQIFTPERANTSNRQTWHASYEVVSAENVRILAIESRSAIEVVVAKLLDHTVIGDITKYYISSPNFGAAIPYTCSLSETDWITSCLIEAGMPAPDAVTVAQVLLDLGDF